MQEISISKASAKEINTLIQIGQKTFFETYADRNSEKDMQTYLVHNFNEEVIKNQIENPNSDFYIAWAGDEPIGYLKTNTGEAQTDLKETESLEIERIYVVAAYHGKKIGQLLYEKAVTTAREKNKSSIWLGVWEENPKAIRFYEKNGFVSFDKHIFLVGAEEQTDYLMRKVL